MINLLRMFTKTEYTVAYRFSDSGILKDTETPFNVLKLKDKNRWYADPFIYEYNGEFYVFMEVFMQDKGYAGLGYSKLVDGKLTEPEVVIDLGYHMSFPMVFEYKGRILMIPETCAASKIQVLECVDFPKKWVRAGYIRNDGCFSDSVLFERDNQYYMFSSIKGEELYASRLFLMKLEEKDGIWALEEEKEISSDSRISRQAGKMLCCNGEIIRVAQDCSNLDYGHALEFLRVENMSFEDYSEAFIREIKTSDIRIKERIRGISGIHTYNREEKFEVIDLKLCTFSCKSTWLKLKIIFGIIIDKIKGLKK